MKLITLLQKTMAFVFCISCIPYLSAQELVWEREAENYDDVTETQTEVTYHDAQECALSNMSGCAFVENISPNSYFTYQNVEVEEEGTYELHIYYTMVDSNGRGIGIFTNYQQLDTIWVMEGTDTWEGFPLKDPETNEYMEGTGGTKVVKRLIYLEKGTNFLRIGGSGNGYGPNMDKFELYTTDEKTERLPMESCSWSWDYTDEIINYEDHSENIRKMYDNNDNTVAVFTGTKDPYVDFEFDWPIGVSGFLLFSGDRGNPIGDNDFEVQAYDEGTNSWINAGKTSLADRGQAKVYACDLVSPSGGFKKVRLLLRGEPEDVITVGEFQIFGFPQAGDIEEVPAYPEELFKCEILNQGTVDEEVSGINGEFLFSSIGLVNESFKEGVTRAVDRKRNTKYSCPGKSFWLQFNFHEPTLVQSYSFAICANTNMDRNPKNWVLKGSEDWGETWETIEEVTDFKFPPANYNNYKFPVNSPKEYLYYRIEVENNGASDYSHTSQFQLLGDTIRTYPAPPTSIKDPVIETPEYVSIYSKSNGIGIKSLNGENVSYAIYSISGMKVAYGNTNGIQEIIMPQGIYIVAATSSKGEVYRTKVMVR